MWAGKHRLYEGLKYGYETDDPLTPWPMQSPVRPLIMKTYGAMHPEFLVLLKQLSNDVEAASLRRFDPSAKASLQSLAMYQVSTTLQMDNGAIIANIPREVPVFGRSNPTQASDAWRQAVPCPGMLVAEPALCPAHDLLPQPRSGRLGELALDLDSLFPGLVLASLSHSTPASEILTRASALADPAVVDGSEAGFVHSLDPSMPGLHNYMFFALAG